MKNIVSIGFTSEQVIKKGSWDKGNSEPRSLIIDVATKMSVAIKTQCVHHDNHLARCRHD